MFLVFTCTGFIFICADKNMNLREEEIINRFDIRVQCTLRYQRDQMLTENQQLVQQGNARAKLAESRHRDRGPYTVMICRRQTPLHKFSLQKFRLYLNNSDCKTRAIRKITDWPPSEIAHNPLMFKRYSRSWWTRQRAAKDGQKQQ